MSLRKIFCILLLAVLHSGVASAQHRVGVQGAVITKFKLTDKLFLNQYGEYCHDFTNNSYRQIQTVSPAF